MSRLDGQATTVPDLTTIGSYRLLEELGQGGMGTVFLGEHTLLGRRAAIKVLHPQFSVRRDIVERFFNEARATTAISDPGIVQIFDFGIQDSVAYIVMEHLVGETLLERLQARGVLPEAELLRLARQLALSLHAAHARGVVHRDLKPDNVFIVADAEALGGERTKILDFGIAKLTDDDPDRLHTQTGVMLGTPSYMSPEQCRGLGEIDHRSDIYSLGCMMFRCVTGRLVFETEGAGDMIVMHVREPAPAPSQFANVRPELDAIILRCLAKQPSDRYSSMHALAIEVDALLRATTSPPGTSYARLTPLPPGMPTRPAPTPDTTQPPTTLPSAASAVSHARARRRWPLIAGLALGITAGVIAVAVVRGRDAAPQVPASAPAVVPTSTPTVDAAAAPAVPVTNTVEPAHADAAPAPPPTIDRSSTPTDAGVTRPRAANKRDAKPSPVKQDDFYNYR